MQAEIQGRALIFLQIISQPCNSFKLESSGRSTLKPEVQHRDTRIPILHACDLRCTKVLTGGAKQDKDEVECG